MGFIKYLLTAETRRGGNPNFDNKTNLELFRVGMKTGLFFIELTVVEVSNVGLTIHQSPAFTNIIQSDHSMKK